MDDAALARIEERWDRGLAEVKADVREMRGTLQELVDRLDDRHEKLDERVRHLENRGAWTAGALAALGLAWPFVARKLGLL